MATMTKTTTEPQTYRLRGTVAGDDITFFLRAGAHLVGSDFDHEMALPWEGVSRRHALLRVEDDHVVVIDQQSKNGTFLNGHRIKRAEVEVGDVLSFGPVELRLETVAPEDALLAVALMEERGSEALSGSGFAKTSFSKTTAPFHRSRGDQVERWLRFIRSYVDDLSAAPEGCGVALSRLADELGTRGACLLTFGKGRDETLIAVGGEVDAETLKLWLDELPELDAEGRSALFGEGLLVSRLEATGYVVPLEHAYLALLVIGSFRGRQASEPLLSTLLALTRKNVSLPAWDDGPEISSSLSKLRFPAGYVRGRSPAIEKLYRQLEPLVESELPVLIRGETGVGKELFAQILHLSSARARGPFVAINCAAIPADLLEAELFGIGDRVATGVAGRPGQFLKAQGGTLFLDEVGEIPPALQAKLLRVLQEKMLQPVGRPPIAIDVRLVTATNASLETLIEKGAFRRDLYFRIAGFVLQVPTLAERRRDIPLLIESFLKRLTKELDKPILGLTVGALDRLMEWPWPGNVRELEHEIQRLFYSCPRGGTIDSSMVTLKEHQLVNSSPSASEAPGLPTLELAELERLAILEALRRTEDNQVQAARLLGVSRHVLRRRLDLFKVPSEPVI